MLTSRGSSLVPRNLGYPLLPSRPSRPGPARARFRTGSALTAHRRPALGPHTRLTRHQISSALLHDVPPSLPPLRCPVLHASSCLDHPAPGRARVTHRGQACAGLLHARAAPHSYLLSPTLACLPVPLTRALKTPPHAVDLCATCVITSGLFAHSSSARITHSGSARAGAPRSRAWQTTARQAQAPFGSGPSSSHLRTHVLTFTQCIHILALLD